MKTLIKTIYRCEICGKEYTKKSAALSCESRTISKDKGVRIGDVVFITGGEDNGKCARVENIKILDKYWGEHAWEDYWHTVAVEAKSIGGFGTRFLTWNNYEKLTST